VSGSSNPVGTSSNLDRTAFHPYFSFKDVVTVFLFLILFAIIIFYAPDKLGSHYLALNKFSFIKKLQYFMLKL